MNTKIIFFYFVINLFVSTNLFSQFEYYNEDESPIISIDIKELNYDVNYIEYFAAGFATVCEGSLDSSLHYLLHIPKSRLRVNGQVPKKNIFVNAKNIHSGLSFDFNKIVIDVLQKQYNFDTIEVKDSCEVWVLEIKNNDVFSKFDASLENRELYSGVTEGVRDINKNGVTKKYFILNDMPIEFFAQFLDNFLEKIVYLNINGTKKYSLHVPIDIIKSPYPILNQYLEDTLGLTLKKEQRLESFILATFHN